jgi:hypothetical protein
MLSLLVLTACGQFGTSEYGDDLLPTEDQLKINMPAASDSAKSPQDPEDWAMYYDATRNVTAHVNGMITFVLGSVYLVTHTQKPSWVDEDKTQAMWGPYSDSGLDPTETGVMVMKNEDGSLSWTVFQVPNGGTVEADAVNIVEGEVDAGSTRDDASGRFALDFTTANSLDPAQNLVGTWAVEYAYDAEGVAAVASAEDYGLENGARWDAVYAYDEDYEGAGEMDLAYNADVNASGTDELVTLKSRWQADGMGRGDATIAGGDVAREVTSSECWGTDFKTSYWTDSIGLYEEVGEESVCAFTPASYADEASFEIVGE